MIAERAANLKALVEAATQAADLSKQDAALASVQDIVETAQDTITQFGVTTPPWRDEVPADDRAAIHSAAQNLIDAVRPLEEANDAALVALGQVADKGQLRLVYMAGAALQGALQEAHQAVLQTWADRVWPRDRLADLKILGQLTKSTEAQRVVATMARLKAATANVTAADLERTHETVVAAQALAGELEQIDVPPEIVSTWTEAEEAREEGIALTAASLQLHQWLLEHDAGGNFRLVAEQ